MTDETVRVGIVGAGGNFRDRHIPGFKAIEGVELVGVANRSRESGQRAAAEFGIQQLFQNRLEKALEIYYLMILQKRILYL